jgi:hypothetical protein
MAGGIRPRDFVLLTASICISTLNLAPGDFHQPPAVPTRS